ncbi:MAG: AI-2E family transporter [Eubacterium sp.]|nr:AI-2E family transporter [Eubacterium sp.]
MKYLKDENVRKKLFMGMVLIVFFFICYNIKEIWGWIGRFFNIILPFIIGGAIAFVLNVPMRWVEKGILRDRKKFSGSKWAAFRRVLSLIITLLLAALLLTLLSYMIIPQLAFTISQLIRQVPTGIKKLTVFAEEQFNNEPIIRQIIQELADDWQSILEKVMSILKDSVNGVLEGGINAVTGIVSGFFNFIVGFIFALYILVQKEKLGTQARMILYALFDRKAADEVVAVAGLAEKTFASFISGQCTEALILASMFSLSMTIMKLPYALLVGLLIGATSLIPIIGTFIGCVIGALLILLVDPTKALVFVILFIILQQIEGNLIYPKVVGDSVGLPGIWVLFSVTVGGSMFGVTGIIVFIPLISVLYSLFRRYIYEKLLEKDIKDDFDYEEKFKRPTETAGRTLVKKLAGRNGQGKKTSNRKRNKTGNRKPENKQSDDKKDINSK